MSLLLALLTVLFVGWTAWLRYRPQSQHVPLAVGARLPPLRLLDLQTSQPLLLLGTKGNVTWIVFWTARSAEGKAGLERLEPVWKRLKAHKRFSMMAAAIDSDPPELVREALEGAHATLPVYRASAETLHRFDTESVDPPLHVLVDGDGQIAALVRGGGAQTIDRLAKQAERWLQEMDPLGPTRFACDESGRRRTPSGAGSRIHQTTIQTLEPSPRRGYCEDRTTFRIDYVLGRMRRDKAEARSQRRSTWS